MDPPAESVRNNGDDVCSPSIAEHCDGPDRPCWEFCHRNCRDYGCECTCHGDDTSSESDADACCACEPRDREEPLDEGNDCKCACHTE